MSVITFWNNGKEQSGKTISMVSIATFMAIEHNIKILLISTGHQDEVLNNCFWKPKKEKKNMGIFGPNTNLAMEDGIEGLSKMVKANRLQPENITNYAKIVFKDRLEILQGCSGSSTQYDEVKKTYPEIINLANKYYDLVLVDLDKEVEKDIENDILKQSNLIIANLSQRLTSIDDFIEIREEQPILKTNKTLILISRYDKFSKYNIKNISRYMRVKNEVSTIPYNTLLFEAAEEAKVPDFFLKIRNMDIEDRNGFFLSEVKKVSDNIMYRLQNLQTKM